MARAKKERPADPDRLVRRSAGDLHTEDGRFEVSSTGGAGRWYVTDTERHDGLGLALVLGPFGTLDEVRAAIPEQRAEPAGDDGPLPAPPKGASSATAKGRSRRAMAPAPDPELARGPGPDPARVPEPEPEPEPPPRPPVRVTRPRWRRRHDDGDEVVDVVRRITDGWLSGDTDAVRDDLHEGLVVQPPEPALEGRDAATDAWRASAAKSPATAWVERELEVHVVGASALMGYRFELEREVEDELRRERGRDVWVLTLTEGRWLAAFRMTIADTPEDG